MWRATTPAGLFPEWVGGAVDPFDLDGRVEGFRGTLSKQTPVRPIDRRIPSLLACSANAADLY
jgi:hypothetical protein